jgi:TonB family protein
MMVPDYVVRPLIQLPPDDQPNAPPPSMRPLPIDAVATEFAKYLSAVHMRMHPFFTGEVLSKLDQRPPNDPTQDKGLVTRLEIALRASDGRIANLEVRKTSGVAEFDRLALESVRRAEPFPIPPHKVVSADGNVYVGWSMHRDGVLGCSMWDARPYLFGPSDPGV